ncbi:ABC transporter ATP-binding protein [Caloramator sp. ALD01]|uniref:ABC transporter ATP-binding protein n=1 Tax=Caloramator sp. ALD01 TaxID=1031288 RepID=UPI0004209A04|nr:ABC transporter ATP-binding protein [Caloramator sp. ALD01]
MLRVNGLYKKYDDFEAIKNVSLYIPRGVVYGLIGSNGAGKTTLLKTVTGIFEKDRGTVTLNEKEIYENVEAKKKIFFIADNPYFYPGYTVKDMANFYKTVYETWDEVKYERLRGIFKIDENKKVRNMSKGMQKQVAIWLGLSTNTDVLILDEPLDGLDAVIRQRVKKLIFQEVIDRQLTVLISSHNLRELEDFCDYVAILHSGEVILEKEVEKLKSSIFKVEVAFNDGMPEELMKRIKLIKAVQKGRMWVLVVEGERIEIEKTIQSYNPILFDIVSLTLEEIFMYEMEGIGYEYENINY